MAWRVNSVRPRVMEFTGTVGSSWAEEAEPSMGVREVSPWLELVPPGLVPPWLWKIRGLT